MNDGIHRHRAAIAAACLAVLSACGSSNPPVSSIPPTPAPSGPLAPVMRCAPDPDAMVVAAAECGTRSAEQSS